MGALLDGYPTPIMLSRSFL